MLLVCYSLLNSQNISINNSEKRLVLLKKQQQLHRKRSYEWPMVSFINNGSKIGYSFKPKIAKFKVTFLR